MSRPPAMTWLAAAALALFAGGFALAGAPEYREVQSPTGDGIWSIAIAADERGLSKDVKSRYAGQHVRGEYLLFVRKRLEVERVDVVTSIAGCDEFVRHYFTSERHVTPDEAPVRFRQRVELVFPPAAAPATASAAPVTNGAPVRFRAVPPEQVAQANGYNAMPHLPPEIRSRDGKPRVGQYIVYVDLDGSVPRVDVVTSIPGGDAAIIETLKTWRFKPPVERVRFIRRFAFDVR